MSRAIKFLEVSPDCFKTKKEVFLTSFFYDLNNVPSYHNFSNDIEIENFVGTIAYFFDGKVRKYFPDFLIKKSNTVAEIKSSYTYECEKEQNEAKKEATINNGFNFKFVINKNYTDL